MVDLILFRRHHKSEVTYGAVVHLVTIWILIVIGWNSFKIISTLVIIGGLSRYGYGGIPCFSINNSMTLARNHIIKTQYIPSSLAVSR